MKQGSKYGMAAVIFIFTVMILNTPVYAAEPTPTSRQLVEKSEDEDSTQVGGNPDQAETAGDTLPDIEIYIDVPEGFYNESTTVRFSLKTKDGSMPSIKSVRARAGKKDNYTDVTESMSLVITEDCTVNVIATDSNGRTYERSRKITCFDKTAPTLNASVSEGILEVNAKDNLSGIKSIIISGYEYTDIEDGKLTIRLSQFDAGYEKFNIQAVDNAGNKSDTYKVKNPYYKSKDSDSDYNPAVELPKDTQPTETGDSTAEVTEHVKVDKDGDIIVAGLNLGDLLSGSTGEETGENEEGEGIKISAIGDILEYLYPKEDDALVGREFYTITTKSGKTFYLIIDKNGDKETVRFLTDITENDLLHVVKSDTQSLPRNSAAKDSTIKDSALPNNNSSGNTETESGDGYSDTREMSDEEVKKVESEQKQDQDTEKKELSFIEQNMSYIIMAIAGLIAIILGYYFKVVKVRRNRNAEDGPAGDERDTEDSEEDYLGITQDDANKK